MVEVAADLFYAQGYRATGIKQIMDAVGIAKGTFYTHFTSKEELGIAWLRKRHLKWNRWLEEMLATKPTPRTKLLGALDFLEQWMANSEYRGCAFLNTLSEVPDAENPMRAEVEAHKLDLRNRFRELVLAHFGGKGSRRIGRMSDIIFLLFEGALIEAQNFREAWPIRTARKATEQLLATHPE
ncbi:MAG: TetR/AcrR family transcriptional regulator [Verrucomicrobiales bacterium]